VNFYPAPEKCDEKYRTYIKKYRLGKLKFLDNLKKKKVKV